MRAGDPRRRSLCPKQGSGAVCCPSLDRVQDQIMDGFRPRDSQRMQNQKVTERNLRRIGRNLIRIVDSWLSRSAPPFVLEQTMAAVAHRMSVVFITVIRMIDVHHVLPQYDGRAHSLDDSLLCIVA